MAELTSNYNLKKPSDDDFYNVQDFNENANIVDGELKSQSERIAKIENPSFDEAKNDDNIQSKESFVGILGKVKRAISRLEEHINSGNPHSDSSPETHKHSATDITSGILPIACGGTGATTAMKALKNLGINVTAEVINLLDGMTENIQTQLNGKSPTTHTHDLATVQTAGFMSSFDKALFDVMWGFVNKQMSPFSSFYITFAEGVSQAGDFAAKSTVQIRNIGNKVQLRGKVTFTMGSGTTDILSFPTDKYPVPDRSNVYKLVPCTGGHIAKIFVRPNGSIACDRISLPGSNTPVTGNITWLQLDMEWDTE